ncbi:hypothetical protein XAP412_240052 [Xanthomonas phaseoli pv. phaseoli]|uniref:Uncharacterized protein n=1 Tax=Xanthomonas campestris pv. phaseoli TaxID=317013 RepID=A0AB38DYQ6_XANCH|nr:hypothetical protein XAP6984_310053 [Xanthomonas phaseoli pv. phaseoli]SON82090.1 hypothetical protein XAP412_240052 [Xanthomonas phaseoli pv. phaseoli]SON86370.1 hypothetical protein XAP7430_260051 [Xanthomonas phaseoli pv. phaseoli]SOO32529.1 hypothetical protein XAP6164_980034 [Xanthomonas phaseoli pv. phaseoli]
MPLVHWGSERAVRAHLTAARYAFLAALGELSVLVNMYENRLAFEREGRSAGAADEYVERCRCRRARRQSGVDSMAGANARHDRAGKLLLMP